MVTTDFIPIDYETFDWEGRNHVKIIGRNSKGRRVCVIDTCDVFMWAILKSGLTEKEIGKIIEKIKKIKIITAGRETTISKIEVHDKRFLEKPVKALKIYATNYKDLHDVADRLDIEGIEKRRGYDLGFISHYIIEKKVRPLQWYEIEGEALNGSYRYGGISNTLDVEIITTLDKKKEINLDFIKKTLAYDIETDEFKVGKGEIIMVSLVGEGYEKVISCKKDSDLPYVEYVKSEKELIQRFCDEVQRISPDFLVGYFSDGFDLPYLRARAEKHRIRLSLGLDGSQPRMSRGILPTARISGIVHMDLLKFIQTAYSQYMQSETLSLNEVAREFLGDGKKEFKHCHSSKIEENEWKKYFEYNLHDSKLTYQLFWKFWNDVLEFTRVIQEPVFDVTRNGMSNNVEDFILHNLERFNEIPEKKPTHDEIGERRRKPKYEGAFVFEPTPGLYEDVSFFDFTSMHASIIVSFNISKATMLEKKGKNSHESPQVDLDKEKKVFYFSKEPGFFPSLLREIVTLRKKYKKELKDKPDSVKKARSNSYKLLANAYYGYLGFFGARYYSREAAATTLAYVRKFNKEIIDKTNSEGFKAIYADTDSVAFTRKNKTKEGVVKFLEKLNSELPGIMELELEGFFKRGLWVTKRTGTIGAKKKYALLGEDDKIKVRGFETVRRDWCRLARVVQNNVLRYVLENGNEKKALEYVKETVKKIKQRKVSKEDLIIRTQLKKPISEYRAISPHVIAARKMKSLHLPIDPGSLIEFYISESHEGKKLVRERVKLPSEEGDFDIDYYLDHQILPAVENILQVFGINIKETMDGKRQTTLGDF